MGKDEVDSASVSSLPESTENIPKVGEEKGEKDINKKPAEEKASLKNTFFRREYRNFKVSLYKLTCIAH